jgi:hypothetical protein
MRRRAMSTKSVAPKAVTLVGARSGSSVPLASIAIKDPDGFTLSGDELARVIALAEHAGGRCLIDTAAINMELRGLAVLMYALGQMRDTPVDEEFVFTFVEGALRHMAARLEAGPSDRYVVTIDPKAVA